MLFKMLEWQVGIANNFSVSVGEAGKYFERYLSPEDWRVLLATYPAGDPQAVWNALFAAGELFRRAAGLVAAEYGYDYPAEDDRRVSAHLRRVQHLPADAAEM
jgi:aminoglycoside 6-adenylyltransferase